MWSLETGELLKKISCGGSVKSICGFGIDRAFSHSVYWVHIYLHTFDTDVARVGPHACKKVSKLKYLPAGSSRFLLSVSLSELGKRDLSAPPKPD